jgi:dethiobiotin synthetase
MHPTPDLFVTGTDTGVGKSVVSLLLMQFLFAKGRRPFYLKLFQTGCDHPGDVHSDAKFIYDHTSALKGRDPSRSVIFCYPAPRAPYYAAVKAQHRIDLDRMRKRVAEEKAVSSPLVIEGAGGLLVPVTRDLMMIDVIKELECRPLLVARAGLGTINHTLLSLEAIRRRQIEPLGVIFVNAGPFIAEWDLVEENIEAVRRFGGIRVAGVIEPVADFHRPPDSVYEVFEEILES